MSDPTATLELYPSDDDSSEPLADTQELPVGSLPGFDPADYEYEPATLSIPIAGGTTASMVLDEPDPGYRSDEALALSPRRARLGLITLATGAFAVGANEASVVAMSTTIAAGLDVPVSSIGLLATAFALTVVVATLPLTILTRRVSRRLALSATFGVWTAGVLVVANSDGLGMFATGRVMSATAHALFWAVVAPAAASLFAPHMRARTVTTVMLGSAAAGVLGTPLVTAFGNGVSWQSPYWGLAVLGVVLAVALALVLPSSRSASGPHHTVGDLPSRPAFARVLVVTLMAATGMSLTWTYVVPLLTQVGNMPVSSLPLLFALGGAVAVAATLGISGHLSRRPVHTVALGIAGLLLAFGLLAIGQTWSAVAFQVVQAASWAIVVTALLNWAMRHTPWRTEMGAGAYTVMFNVGAALGPVLGGLVVARWGAQWLPFVSLGLTLAAAAVVATVDRRSLQRLSVPRQVRAALAAQAALNERRREWWWRTQLNNQKPRAYADLAARRPRKSRARPAPKTTKGGKSRKDDGARKNPAAKSGEAVKKVIKGAAAKSAAALPPVARPGPRHERTPDT
ncbi:MFS transporter [Demequina sp. SO4-13]|uniref:MFS transporter n=1 Tax=Demequina sp. SO4-13 TaxID=3401027 RepID=UPI003AF453D1